MLQPCSNPDCSVQFAIGVPQCPACGAPSLQPEAAPEPTRRIWTGGQVTISLIGTLAGAAPGAYWLAHARSNQSAIICGLGAIIGFGLSAPGVSIARVLSGTAVSIASKRTFGRMIGEAWSSRHDNPDELPTDDRGRRG